MIQKCNWEHKFWKCQEDQGFQWPYIEFHATLRSTKISKIFKNFVLILDCLKTILIPEIFNILSKFHAVWKTTLFPEKFHNLVKFSGVLKTSSIPEFFLKYFKNFRLGQLMMGEPIYTILYNVFSTLSPFLKSLTISG